MVTIRQLCGIALLLACIAAAISLSVLFHAATAAISAVPSAVAAQIEAARQDVLARSERQIAAARRDLMAQASAIRETADRRTGDALQRLDVALAVVDTRSGQAIDQVVQLRGDLQPLLASAVLIEAHADKAVVDLHPQLLGLVAASKVTAGETAQAMRDVRNAVPPLLGSVQRFSTHMEAMSVAGEHSFVATQHTMENFSAASKPLPRWARIVLGVGPPIAQAGAAAVGAGVALGWGARR